NLEPVTVGGIVVAPPWRVPELNNSRPEAPLSSSRLVIIAPSMGFGTGHHASTRLCLAAMQRLDLTGRFVLDVGTGSGVLAIASRRLGAASVLGIDNDPDAVQSASDNLSLNDGLDHVRFEVADLRADALPPADLITANLTGALLFQGAPRLLSALRPRGTLILSGLVEAEELGAGEAFAALTPVSRDQEEGWLCLTYRARPAP